jgi:hypothetical protein
VCPSVGRDLLIWRNVVCGALSTLLPVSVVAQGTRAAVLRSDGTTLVNGNSRPSSSALFPDDLIRTPKAVGARIEATGSFADISPETMVQFEGDELVIDHGSLFVSTSSLLRVRVGCVTVTPVNPDWTNYEVTDVDGKVTVSAVKSDVYLDARSRNFKETKPGKSNRTIVRQGEQKSRSEKCGAAEERSPDYVPAKDAILNSPWVKFGGGLIGLTCLELCHGDDPVSPSKPK